MRRLFTFLVVTAVLAPMLALTPAPAGAAGVPLTCNVAATTTIVRNQVTGRYIWTINGKGTCTDSQSTYFADVLASGNSDGLGACTDSDVRNLDLNTTLTLVSSTTGQSQAILLNFGAPSTTYPVTTPFFVSRGGSVVGGGTLFTHIFLACPPLGTPSTAIYFELTR